MEDYRAFLARRFLHPVQLTRALLVTPMYVGLALVGANGAVLLAAFQRWHRAENRGFGPGPGMLLGVFVSGLAVTCAPAGLLPWLAPLAIFVAGVVSVLRPAKSAAMMPPLRDEAEPIERVDVLIRAAAGVIVGVAVFLAIASDGMRVLGVTLAVLANAAAAGWFVSHGTLRSPRNYDISRPALLLGLAALLLPYGRICPTWLDAEMVRLSLVTVCAAACIARVRRRPDGVSRGAAPAFVLGGFGLAVLLAPAGAALSRSGTPIVNPTIDNPLVAAERRLVIADPFRARRVRPLPPSAPASDGWQVDLAHPAPDVVVITGVEQRQDAGTNNAELGRRLLRRSLTPLAEGGRLVIELPTAPFVAAALEGFDPAEDDPSWRGYRLIVSGATDRHEALVYGRDIPALVARQRALTDFDVVLEPLTRMQAGGD